MPAEARRILSHIEFHFTPKHASWLNMVEIEIGVMVRHCVGRRIADKTTLVSDVAHWVDAAIVTAPDRLDVHRRAVSREARPSLPSL